MPSLGINVNSVKFWRDYWENVEVKIWRDYWENVEKFEGITGKNVEKFEGITGKNVEKFEGITGKTLKNLKGLLGKRWRYWPLKFTNRKWQQSVLGRVALWFGQLQSCSTSISGLQASSLHSEQRKRWSILAEQIEIFQVKAGLATTLDNKKEPFPRFAARKTLRSCDIMLDDARSTQGKVICDCPRLLPCADRASSSMISHDGTVFFSPQISGMVLLFVQGSTFKARNANFKLLHDHWKKTNSLIDPRSAFTSAYVDRSFVSHGRCRSLSRSVVLGFFIVKPLNRSFHLSKKLAFFSTNLYARVEPNFSQGCWRPGGIAMSMARQLLVYWLCGWLVSAIFLAWIEEKLFFPWPFSKQKMKCRCTFRSRALATFSSKPRNHCRHVQSSIAKSSLTQLDMFWSK